MAEIKWTTLSEVKPDREYVAFAEMGERQSVWSFFGWIMRSRKISEQLKNSTGIIGFTARLEFFGKKAVMVAVFDDENSLTGFAHAGQHAQCMKAFKSDFAQGMKSAKWHVLGSEVPLKIDDAISRIGKS